MSVKALDIYIYLWTSPDVPALEVGSLILLHSFLSALVYSAYKLSITGIMALSSASSSGCSFRAPAMMVANPGPSAIGMPPMSR